MTNLELRINTAKLLGYKIIVRNNIGYIVSPGGRAIAWTSYTVTKDSHHGLSLGDVEVYDHMKEAYGLCLDVDRDDPYINPDAKFRRR